MASASSRLWSVLGVLEEELANLFEFLTSSRFIIRQLDYSLLISIAVS